MKRLKSLHILYYLLSIKIQDIILDGEVSIIIQGVIDNKAREPDLSRRVLPLKVHEARTLSMTTGVIPEALFFSW